METNLVEKVETLGLEDIPRHTPSNPYNFTGEENALIEARVKALMELYPNLPVGILRMATQSDLLNEKEKNNNLDNK